MVARLEQREQRGRLRGDPAGERHRAGAALEVRHPLLEHGDRRVHDARVRVAVLLQVEVRGRRLRVLEHVAGRLEDRHRARARVRVGPLPGVQLPGLESERAGFLGAMGHVGTPAFPCLASSGPSQEAADDGRLPRLLEQEAVVAVRRLDDVALDRLAERSGAPSAISRDADGGYSQSELNAISSVRAETPASARGQRPAAVLPGEVEVGQRARRVEVGVGVEPPDERVGLVAQVALDLELRAR